MYNKAKTKTRFIYSDESIVITLTNKHDYNSDQLREANNALKDANRRINELMSANAALTAERDNLAAALRDTEDALKVKQTHVKLT